MAVISYAPTRPDQRAQRRRILFSDYSNPKRSRTKQKPAPVDEPPKATIWDEIHVPTVLVVSRKGMCPKCGRHIGRGIAFHVKSCPGLGDER